MAYTHQLRQTGDRILSAEWNSMGQEVQRLEAAKVGRDGNDVINGPLGVRGDLGVGAPARGAAVRVLKKPEDGNDPSHGALVLGADDAGSASLRLGYNAGYSWLQSRGKQTLSLNPRGGEVGIGTDTPRSRLSVAGSLAVGAGYAAGAIAPPNGMIVEGTLGIGTPGPAPDRRLHVEGNSLFNGGLRIRDSVHFENRTRQMLNLWTEEYGIGVQGSTHYSRSAGHFAWYRGGVHNDAELNGGGGAPLMVMRADGRLGVGTHEPQARLHVAGGGALVNGVSVGSDVPGIDYQYEYETVGVGAANMNLRLQSPNAVLVHTGSPAVERLIVTPAGDVGIGTTAPTGRLDVRGGDIVAGGAANGQRFIWHTRQQAGGDFLHFTTDDRAGNWEWGKGFLYHRASATLQVNGTVAAQAVRTRITTVGGAHAVGLSTANTWQMFPDLRAAVNITTQTTVLVYYQISGGSGSSHLLTRLMIDGAEQWQTRTIVGDTGYHSPSSMWMGELAPGNHVVEVQYRTPSGGVNNPSGTDFHSRVLRVLVLGT